MSPEQSNLSSLQQAIKDKLHQFELLALLRLLDFHGYRQIWYRSSEQLVSEPQLMEDIKFVVSPDNGEPLVILSLNIGMLGPQSPLPSYFLKLRDTLLLDDTAFIQYIGFFDHILISELVRQLFPELSDYYGSSWDQWQRNCLLLSNLKAIRNVHMLFKAIYPEYKIHCAWQSKSKWQSGGSELGHLVLGKTTGLGGVAAQRQGWLRVLLTQREQKLPLQELQMRLQKLALPLYNALSLPLKVCIEGQLAPLQLATDTTRHSTATVLGYHPFAEASVEGYQTLFAANTYGKGDNGQR